MNHFSQTSSHLSQKTNSFTSSFQKKEHPNPRLSFHPVFTPIAKDSALVQTPVSNSNLLQRQNPDD